MATEEAITGIQRDSITRSLWAIARGPAPALINRPVVVGLVLLAGDVLLISRYQPSTALTILRYTPPLTLLAGVVINVMPLLLMSLAVGLWTLAVVDGVGGSNPSRSVTRLFAALGTYGSALALLDTALDFPIHWAVVGLAVWVLAIGMGQTERGFNLSGLLTPLAALAGLTLVVLALTLSPYLRESLARPFLPAERIELSSDGVDSSLVGYVLDVDQSGRWTTLMDDAGRAIQIVSSDSIDGRRLCNLPGQSSYIPYFPLVQPASAAAVEPCG